MWENAYLSTKNQKASRALKWALDPAPDCSLHSHDSTSLCQQLSVSEAGVPPWPNPGSAPGMHRFYIPGPRLYIPKLCAMPWPASCTWILVIREKIMQKMLFFIFWTAREKMVQFLWQFTRILTFEVPFSHLLAINNGSICRFYFLVTETRVTLKRLSGHSFQVVKSDTLISVIASVYLILVSTCQ